MNRDQGDPRVPVIEALPRVGTEECGFGATFDASTGTMRVEASTPAIEALVSGKGVGPVQEAWHHTGRVTTGHPRGDWAVGWDEVLATWSVFASFGREDRGGSRVQDLQVHLYGDVAYTTCIFVASPAFGSDRLACTNVLHRVDGVWKIVHHHADKSPSMGAALEKIAREE